MSKYHVNPSTISGCLRVPSSKSQSLRAILFGALAHGKTRVDNYLPSPDITAMVEACRLLGADIEIGKNRIDITGLSGIIKCAEDIIHAGNSGIVLRFCSAIGALASLPIVITGDFSIRHHRPMKPLLSALEQLQVHAKSMRDDGYAPVIIQGPIKPGKAVINGEDSQPISALLVAASMASGPIELDVINPGEKPWVALTLNWFDRLGIPYKNQDFTYYRIEGNSKYEGFSYKVPGDFSSAAFPIAAALVTQSELTVHNLDMEDPQGDKKIIEIFSNMGAKIDIDNKNSCVHVKKGARLTGISVDINDCIDALPILAVVACFAEGETVIGNASVARQKESNRIQCIVSELQKMGANISEWNEGIKVTHSPLRGAEVISYHDHRLAMSLAMAGMGAMGTTVIHHVDCISKTYPTFFEDFIQVGARMQKIGK